MATIAQVRRSFKRLRSTVRAFIHEQWLDERCVSWAVHRVWRDPVSEDTKGLAALTRVVGETPAQARLE